MRERDKALLRTYGITREEYERILASQDGVCAICHQPPGARRLCVDHDHKTGFVRGLACWRCNYGLSWYRDSFYSLLGAAVYIAKPPAFAIIGQRAVPPKRKKKRRKIRNAA